MCIREANEVVETYALESLRDMLIKVQKYNTGGKNGMCRCKSCTFDLLTEMNNLLDWLESDYPDIGHFRYTLCGNTIVFVDMRYSNEYFPNYREWRTK